MFEPKTIQVGSPVYIEIRVYDEELSPPLSPPNPPPGAVKLSLTDPNGTVQVNLDTMTAMTGVSAGCYNYTYPTTTSSATGTWLAQYSVYDSGGAVQYISPWQNVFELTS